MLCMCRRAQRNYSYRLLQSVTADCSRPLSPQTQEMLQPGRFHASLTPPPARPATEPHK